MWDTIMKSNRVIELFGRSLTGRREIAEQRLPSVSDAPVDWQRVVSDQRCPFIGKRCYKVRKSDPQLSIGTCTVRHGKAQQPVVICPARLLERHQIFIDCLHLLTTHTPGNELHVVSEVGVPGGSVDYFIVSALRGKVKDFVGVEIQTLDTTGTVWPERQSALESLGFHQEDTVESSNRSFGMNWKMTAKTILMQMHHKIQTFEHLQ